MVREIWHLLIEGNKRALDPFDQGLCAVQLRTKPGEKLGPLFQAGSDLQARSRLLLTHPALLRAILFSQLLGPSPKLLLKTDIARALHRSHEPRELPLLGFDDRDALFLELQRRVEQGVDTLLVRLASRSQLLAELAPGFPLLRRDLTELGGKTGVGLLQLRLLCLGESNPVLGELGDALAKLLLQGRPVRFRKGRCHRLGISSPSAQRDRQRSQPERSLHGLNDDQRLSPLSTEITWSGSDPGSASKPFMSFISCTRLPSLSPSASAARARACGCRGRTHGT